jgi:hypothetical protein
MIGMFVVFRHFVRAIRYAVRAPEAQALMATTAVVLVAGTLFYMFAEGWSVIDALYFSVITLATIGYGDLTPTNDLAKLFTIFYVLIGIGLLASTVATIANAAITANADRRAHAHAVMDAVRDGAEASPPDGAVPAGPLVGRFVARHTQDAVSQSGPPEDGGTTEEDRT